jgi:hypothetical protein
MPSSRPASGSSCIDSRRHEPACKGHAGRVAPDCFGVDAVLGDVNEKRTFNACDELRRRFVLRSCGEASRFRCGRVPRSTKPWRLSSRLRKQWSGYSVSLMTPTGFPRRPSGMQSDRRWTQPAPTWSRATCQRQRDGGSSRSTGGRAVRLCAGMSARGRARWRDRRWGRTRPRLR